MSSLKITVYDTEDLNKVYKLTRRKAEFADVRRPKEEQLEPYPLVDQTFLAEVKDARGHVVLTLTVEIISALEGTFAIKATRTSLRPLKNKELTWSVHVTKNGSTDRLWGDEFEVLAG